MPHTYCSLLFHCVFSTKERRNFISDDVRERLWAYIGGIAREHETKALAVGGTEDHVHILLSLPARDESDRVGDARQSSKAHRDGCMRYAGCRGSHGRRDTGHSPLE